MTFTQLYLDIQYHCYVSGVQYLHRRFVQKHFQLVCQSCFHAITLDIIHTSIQLIIFNCQVIPTMAQKMMAPTTLENMRTLTKISNPNPPIKVSRLHQENSVSNIVYLKRKKISKSTTPHHLPFLLTFTNKGDRDQDHNSMMSTSNRVLGIIPDINQYLINYKLVRVFNRTCHKCQCIFIQTELKHLLEPLN